MLEYIISISLINSFLFLFLPFPGEPHQLGQPDLLDHPDELCHPGWLCQSDQLSHPDQLIHPDELSRPDQLGHPDEGVPMITGKRDVLSWRQICSNCRHNLKNCVPDARLQSSQNRKILFWNRRSKNWKKLLHDFDLPRDIRSFYFLGFPAKIS